ncbi:hypothetical protein AVEN_206396-1 [Araneus ventricosus]|uniref:Uncharacterized protein n=1 Tax=Araneus ventricosus TaxID=182803 RepID=A0A4Y2ENZ9_ARAVE|nr:hypothetical protein AVEN_206396-1 [Araneus ventricosus]
MISVNPISTSNQFDAYTNGSRIVNDVDFAVCIFKGYVSFKNYCFKLKHFDSLFQAKIEVINFAAEWALKTTRGLFRDGPRNFEPRSDDEDDTRAGTPSPNFSATPEGGRLATTYDLAGNRPHGGTSMESGFEPATLRFRCRDLTTRPQRPSREVRPTCYGSLLLETPT